MYIYKLDLILELINHSTFRMSPIDVKSSTHIYFNTAKNDKNSKFKVGDHVRISKHKNILQKVALQIGQKKLL